MYKRQIYDLISKKKTDIKIDLPYILNLSDDIISVSTLEQSCLILKEKQISRAQIRFANNIINKAHDTSIDVFKVNEIIFDEVDKITNIGVVNDKKTNAELAIEVSNDIEKASKQEGITGIRTGFNQQDRLFGGFKEHELIILAARPGMGKTAKMLCDVYNMVVNNNKTVMIFSFEMSPKQLFKRLVSLATGIDGDKISSGDFNENDWGVFNSSIGDIIKDELIIIDCTSGWTMSDISLEVKAQRKKSKVDCIYVDYLQLISHSNSKASREQQISSISRRLKRLSGEMKCPVIALSQLSRSLENRSDKKPKLSDLRESGAIEQDADIVTFLHRPNYYGEAEPGEEDITYFVVAKHRNGALMDITMKYIHERAQFLEYDELNF